MYGFLDAASPRNTQVSPPQTCENICFRLRGGHGQEKYISPSSAKGIRLAKALTMWKSKQTESFPLETLHLRKHFVKVEEDELFFTSKDAPKVLVNMRPWHSE